MVKEHAFISYLILLFSSTLESNMINSELMIYTKKQRIACQLEPGYLHVLKTSEFSSDVKAWEHI